MDPSCVVVAIRLPRHPCLLFKELETGLTIFLGLIFIFIKLRRRTMLHLLRYEMAIDVAVTLLTLTIHCGTLSVVIAGTFAVLLTSVGTSLAKRTFGHIDGNQYFPGYMRLDV